MMPYDRFYSNEKLLSQLINFLIIIFAKQPSKQTIPKFISFTISFYSVCHHIIILLRKFDLIPTTICHADYQIKNLVK
jgi:hypothetical protein